MRNWYDLAKFADGEWFGLRTDYLKNNESIIEEAWNLYQQGMSLQQISRQMNIGPNILRGFLSQKEGFKPNDIGGRRPLSSMNAEKANMAADLYREGYTINQIAAHFNVANQTLIPYLMKALNPNERVAIREKFLSKKDSKFKNIVNKIINFKNKNPNLLPSQISKLLGIENHNVKRILEMFYDENLQ